MRTAMFKTDFWLEDGIYELNTDTKAIYLCLLTNPQRDLTPAFKLNDRMLSAYSGFGIEALQLCRKQLVEAGFIYYVEGYYILTKQSYVEPLTGRDSKKIFEREFNKLPLPVREFIEEQGILTSGNSTSTPTGTSTGVIDIDKHITINKDIVKKEDEVSKLYHETVKELKIPVRNYNNLRGYIKRLENELGKDGALAYLDFVKTNYRSLNDDGFKPRLNESMDIYAKRVSIQSWIERSIQKQQRPVAPGGRPVI